MKYSIEFLYFLNFLYIPLIITPEEKIKMCIRHYELALKYDGEHKAVREMRKHSSWYIKGLHNSSEIRNIINTVDDSARVMEILEVLFLYTDYLSV